MFVISVFKLNEQRELARRMAHTHGGSKNAHAPNWNMSNQRSNHVNWKQQQNYSKPHLELKYDDNLFIGFVRNESHTHPKNAQQDQQISKQTKKQCKLKKLGRRKSDRAKVKCIRNCRFENLWLFRHKFKWTDNEWIGWFIWPNAYVAHNSFSIRTIALIVIATTRKWLTFMNWINQ